MLAGLLDVPRAEVQLGEGGALEADLVVRAGGDAFVVDVLTPLLLGSYRSGKRDGEVP